MNTRRAHAAGDGHGAFVQKVSGILFAALFVAALALITVHLRPQQNSPRWLIRSAVSKERAIPATAVQRPVGQVPVNTADAEALATIPGVGPALAEAILAERHTNGLFYYPEDLLCVRGIGEKTLVKLLPYLNLD